MKEIVWMAVLSIVLLGAAVVASFFVDNDNLILSLCAAGLGTAILSLAAER